jgi:hypothetical protein
MKLFTRGYNYFLLVKIMQDRKIVKVLTEFKLGVNITCIPAETK